MTITLPPDLEATLKAEAERLGTTVEVIAISGLRERFPRRCPPFEPRDDWERQLLEMGTDCGVSISNEALSSDGLYD